MSSQFPTAYKIYFKSTFAIYFCLLFLTNNIFVLNQIYKIQNQISTIIYPAKILLFGEHTVIKGSQALAMPINDFYGTWKFAPRKSDWPSLQQQLSQFQQYLEKQGLQELLDTINFRTDLNRGLFFDANIPTGYGLGSSGALCAAVFHRFRKTQDKKLPQLKEVFAMMESFFHGESSGTDPLVSYLQHPILLGNTIQKVSLPKENKEGDSVLFLLDTGIKREASPFIKGFLKRCEDIFYEKKCASQLVPLVDDAIHTFLEGQWRLLFNTMHELSLFQYRYFDFMILDTFKNIWLEGLSSTHFKLKICGAGGGGFILGLSNDFEKTNAQLEKYKLKPIFRF